MRARWIGIATVMSIALVAGVVAVSRDDSAPADRSIVIQSDESAEPSDAPPTPSSAPTASQTNGTSASDVQPIVGPLPVRPMEPVPPCTSAERAELLAGWEHAPANVGVTFRSAGASHMVARGGTLPMVLQVTNRTDVPLEFEDLGDHPMWLNDGGGNLGGVRARTNPEPVHRVVPPGSSIELAATLTTQGCGGHLMPYGAFQMFGGVRTTRGMWIAQSSGDPEDYQFLYVIDPAGKACFDLPDLQTTPPVDGLTAVARPWNVPMAHDRSGFSGRLTSWMHIAITLENSSGHTVSFTEVNPGRRIGYLVEKGGVVGGWESEPTNPPIRREVEPGTSELEGGNGSAYAHDLTVIASGCLGQPMLPGTREIVVALLVQRDGVTYHWRIPMEDGTVTFREDAPYQG